MQNRGGWSRAGRIGACLLAGFLASGVVDAGPADTDAVSDAGAEVAVDPSRFQGLQWRLVGPYRGGRVTAVTGVPGDALTYYMGATGGGVWKTRNGGVSWSNVSDGFFRTGSVGAIAVAPSDPNVVYAGTGEGPVRGVTTSHGDGVYRSTDAGKTWTHVGLERTRHIPRIAVHPEDPDVVWVAAQGSPWTPSPERGVYRSTDGGATWELVLVGGGTTGACDLRLDATNPRILYAAFWDHRRTPWKVRSGGPGSALYKSTDGGTTWKEPETGLPEVMGKIGVAVSPANPERVYALVEAEDGGLYRSDDGGASFRLVNSERVLLARSWYYMHVFADPGDEETVYVLNAPFLKSTDGGRTFRPVPTPHGDNHDLWIHPDHPDWMINGNDGGANVSYDGGKSWSTQSNQPTAQFYRVITDNRFDYHLYAGQQDNSTVAIASRTTDRGIGREDWYAVGGGESAHVAFDPDDPRLVYATSIVGLITEYDTETTHTRTIQAIPTADFGLDPKDLPYRYNWNAPVLVSPHDPATIYHAGNKLLRSRDRGVTWEEISPDLTRDEPEKQGRGGGPITNEAAGAEIYNTIFYVVESPHEAGTIWVGTDDGLVHLTRDHGATWTEVTPRDIVESQVNAIEVSPHDPAVAYLAVTRYKFGDFTPHVFKTADYGKTWKRVVEGIPSEAFVRVVREDPVRRGLLFAGTETGLYVSFDDGARWRPFQRDLPVVPITDLRVHGDDLVAATQGRAFWILDDLSPLRQLGDLAGDAAVHLFAPAPAYRTDGGSGDFPGRGKNPPSGAILDFFLREAPADAAAVTLEILDAEGTVLRTLATGESEDDGRGPARIRIEVRAGHNRVVWDLHREGLHRVPGLFVFTGFGGPRVVPGAYRVRLTAGEVTAERDLEVRADPRVFSSDDDEDWAAVGSIAGSLYDALNELYGSTERVREIRGQIRTLSRLLEGHDDAGELRSSCEEVASKLEDWESSVVQPEQETFQDVINFPNRLNVQMGYLLQTVDGNGPPVTAGSRERHDELLARWSERRAALDRILGEDVAGLNARLRQGDVAPVYVPR